MRWSIVSSLLLFVTSTACLFPTEEEEGTLVGRYHVTASLVRNECGPNAIEAASAYTFDVDLRRDGDLVMWRLVDQPITRGAYQNGRFNFSQVQELPVYAADPVTGRAACNMRQQEDISVATEGLGDAGTQEDSSVDGGVSGTAVLLGTHTIRITTAPGFDCSPSLAASGGPFDALPCQLSYSLHGVRN